MASYLTISPELRANIEADFQIGKTKAQITAAHGIGRTHLKRFFPERFKTYKIKASNLPDPKKVLSVVTKRKPGRPKKVSTLPLVTEIENS